MKAAVFFQKHDKGLMTYIAKKLFFAVFVRGNSRRIKYLRDAGAQIGGGAQ